MIKKISFVLLIALPFYVLLIASTLEVNSEGAPASSTGAPGENTCAVGGCHSDFPVNSGNAVIKLEIEGNPSTYEPGKKYKLTASVKEDAKMRFGFQVVALQERNNVITNAGKMMPIDNNRTQVLYNDIELQDRQYMTYTYEGTSAKETGLGEWSFYWTAPAENAGHVKFYMAAASANNDHTDKGDYIYTTSLTLQDGTTGINTGPGAGSANTNGFIVSPNPVHGKINIHFNEIKNSKAEIILFDLNGRKVKQLYNGNIGGNPTLPLTIEGDLANGVYILKLQTEAGISSKKILIQN